MNIDIETYSSNDILKCGVYKYVEAKDFEILIIAYSIDGGSVSAIDMTMLDDTEFHAAYETFKIALFDPNVKKYAFNANFERTCLAKHFDVDMPPEEWSCTMVNATRLGLPSSLEKVGDALNLQNQKDRAGKNLIRYFSVPCKPTKVNGGRTRNLPMHAPDKWQQFIDYCIRDVEVEMSIATKIKDFPVTKEEQKYWNLDQRINDRGIKLSKELMVGANELDKMSKEDLLKQAIQITGLENPNSTSQLLKWLNEEQGLDIPNLQKKTVQDYLKNATGKAKQMLEIRLQMSKTSVKKYNKMHDMMCADERVRGLFQFYGASTGRWAGRGVQLQNLTKHYMSDVELDIARDFIKAQRFDDLSLLLATHPQDLLSQLVRTTFVAKEGYILAVSDFSAIEARVIAWYAKEQWRLDVFNTHGKIYEASAAQMFGVPIESITKGDPLRQKGKVSELALGYQGGPGALKAMGALDMGIKESELQGLVDSWRKANPNIVNFWKACQDAAINTVRSRKTHYTHGLRFYIKKGLLMIEIPSGRSLAYPKARISENDWGAPVVEYMGLDINRKWAKLKTYGGKLVENIVQATARDLLAVSMLRLDNAGFNIVGHVHDEVIVEMPKNSNGLAKIEKIMSKPVKWAEGLNLNSDGFTSPFYMKD
ncbi:DNA polymerase [Staphylococcus pseudintermedius]|uniref:DNA polymerase n=1 Tax=Staphylococcus pseudintermedius TaxID=283734 RepID=UPI000E2619EC|nr:DNA polymerase [Staphylococcus pseudintermedius]EGQ0369565.1 DNA polymerase [Staphylococcus pseudintermedius]EGQ0382327.1 DNA polymerase [Staphylococcus pseudintermedius]EGQ1291843.1 DNA polymerase [Staphylococcus pseudintermedius]EGQ1659890.1 DNA polymerase [Staphylococcus pseudintermedius]EGQ1663554.1 DNA polymerase [Staphylococcus pseudintermedius]